MIDHTKLKAIRADLDTALLALAKKHGVMFSVGTIKFDATSARATLSMVEMSQPTTAGSADTPAPSPSAQTFAEESWKKLAASFNLRPEWLGQEFLMNGSKFVVVGLKPEKHKNIVLIRRVSTGKQFICAPDALHRGFAALV